MFFWRDSNQNEVDLLTEDGLQLNAYEIKSSATMNNDFFKGLKRFAGISNLQTENLNVVYGGDISLTAQQGKYISWRDL